MVLGILLISNSLFACSCGHVGIYKNRKGSDFVFKGKVIEINEIISTDTITDSEQTVRYRRTIYTFEILQTYKGNKKLKTIDIVGGETDCEVVFKNGLNYIVYAYNDDKKPHYKLRDQPVDEYLTTHMCDRTKKSSFWTFWERFLLRIT